MRQSRYDDGMRNDDLWLGLTYSQKEARTILGLGIKKLNELVRLGLLTRHSFGRKIYYSVSQVQHCLKSMKRFTVLTWVLSFLFD